jgi:hypothetical protein
MGFGFVIGFIDHLQIITTSNCSAVTNSRTLQFTTARIKSSQSAVFIIHSVVTVSDGGRSPYSGFPNYPRASQQLTTTELQQCSNWLLTNKLFTSLPCTALTPAPSPSPSYNILAWTAQKTPFLMFVVQLLPWKHVCLWSGYSATLLYIFLSRGRWPAMGLHATVFYWLSWHYTIP